MLGIVIACTSGFNLSSEYDNRVELSIDFTEEFDIKDVEEISKSVFEAKNVLKVEYADSFKTGAIIKLKTADEEQIINLEEKLKEKYASFKTEDVENEEDEHNHEQANTIAMETRIPKANVYDLIKIYIKPIIITTILSVLLLAIVFRKLGFIKSVIMPICIIIIVNALYVSAFAILRIPVSEYAIAIWAFIYAFSIVGTTLYLKKKANN